MEFIDNKYLIVWMFLTSCLTLHSQKVNRLFRFLVIRFKDCDSERY